MDFDRASLRHCVATLAYRAAKTMRGAPLSFATFRPGPTSKTPVEIVAHMGDLADFSLRLVRGSSEWTIAAPQPWNEECRRFFTSLKAFDDYLASAEPLRTEAARVFQGPVADALTHTGQLAMLRRLHGSPMKGESYRRSEVVLGRIALEQTPVDPKFEFD